QTSLTYKISAVSNACSALSQKSPASFALGLVVLRMIVVAKDAASLDSKTKSIGLYRIERRGSSRFSTQTSYPRARRVAAVALYNSPFVSVTTIDSDAFQETCKMLGITSPVLFPDPEPPKTTTN